MVSAELMKGMMSMQPIIDIKKLKLTLNNKEIIKNIDISVDKSELVFIIGKNGSGKTSLFNCIVGRYKPTAGEIWANGLIGYHEQKAVFIPDMTVRENLQSFNVVFKCGLSKKQMDDLITKVNLEHCIDVNSTKLSGGERQRLSLAITLMRERDIYLFDEAETAMDPIGRKMFFDAVLTIKRKGKTALWISHHIKESLMVADKGYFLADGVAYSFNVKEYSEIAAEYTEEAFARLCEERLVKQL